MLHGADAVLHAHRRRRQRFVLVVVVGLRHVGLARASTGAASGRLDRCRRRARASVTPRPAATAAALSSRRLDQHAAAGLLQRHRAGLRHLLHEVAEAAGAVVRSENVESSCSSVLLSRPSCGVTSRSARTFSARRTSGSACAIGARRPPPAPPRSCARSRPPPSTADAGSRRR